MQPTRLLWRTPADLLAADVGSLAAATAMHLHLAINNFVPALGLVLGGLTEATFTGSTALNAGTGAQPIAYDGETGLLTIDVKEPAGGWRWECTVDPAAPETIFGVYLTDTANAVLWGAQLLPDPVTITVAGTFLEVPYVRLRFLITSPY